MSDQRFQLLHLSDIHMQTKEEFDTSVVLDPLIEQVRVDKEKNGFRPEIIVVTGDIAFKGVKEEYDLAKKFFDELLKAIGLTNEKLFIVPGNHDVNRKKYRPSDRPSYKDMKELNYELENVEFREDLFKGLSDYFDFVKIHYPHLQSKHGNLIPFVTSYQTQCKKTVGLVGLNSAWMCRESADEKIIAIGEFQVKNAMNELKEQGAVDLIINLFHHPLQWLWPDDRDTLKTYLNESIILSGHLHDAGGDLHIAIDGNRYLFQAGGAYLGSESQFPAGYQYITLDWKNDSIRLDFRAYDKGSRKWHLDGKKGTAGVHIFKPANISKTPGPAPEPETPKSLLPEIPEAYYGWVIDRCKHMDIDRLREGTQVVSVSLPEVYIPLMATPPRAGKKIEDEEGLTERLKEERLKDIEELASENDYLLIRGEAGSGKTTLIKHLAYTVIKKENTWGLNGHLPVLIFLKELKAFADSHKGLSPNKVSAEKIFAFYFEHIAQNGLNLDLIRAYADDGRIIFLVDGLDEIEPEFRNFVATSLADFRISYKGLKMLLTGRPHGATGSVADRFGDRRVDVEDFNDSQIETFVRKWFSFVNGRNSGTGNKTADKMIKEMKTHPDIDHLRRNPLMLTAICILYFDEKSLPDQRAELYKKFIINLLVKRFGEDHGRVYKYLKQLAHDMFLKGDKGVDKITAKDMLSRYYPDDTKDGLDERFDRIENDSGLMKLESGMYRFSHLTFQEFLTATYMIDIEEVHYANPIKPFWNVERFSEVIELYIGFLSIDNAGMANRIVKDVLLEKDESDFLRWRLASRSLLDIHSNSRHDDAKKLAVDQMRSIIDQSTAPLILADAGDILGRMGDPRDLKTFVFIQGGKYKLKDLETHTINPFEISKHPVSNGWFEGFVVAGGYENDDFWSVEGCRWRDYMKVRQPLFWDDPKWNCPNAPVVGVSWYEADAFTRWLTQSRNDGFTYRLPSEKEWQAAAAGKKGRNFPWGDTWDEKRCNNKKTGIGKTSSVGLFKLGDTQDGLSDLSGNVWEWTNSDYHFKKERADFIFDPEILKLLESKKIDEYIKALENKERQLPVLRGGSWGGGGADDFRCAFRYRYAPFGRFSSVGFRCART